MGTLVTPRWVSRHPFFLVGFLATRRFGVLQSAAGLTIALSCFHPTDNEVAILALLKPHRHVVQLYGMCLNSPDGRQRLVLELCDRGNVRDYLKALPRDQVRSRTRLYSARSSNLFCKVVDLTHAWCGVVGESRSRRRSCWR